MSLIKYQGHINTSKVSKNLMRRRINQRFVFVYRNNFINFQIQSDIKKKTFNLLGNVKNRFLERTIFSLKNRSFYYIRNTVPDDII